MRETQFIEQNKKKWAEFEHILKVNEKDPDKLSDLFVEITDDLSYSRTFYPNRSVRFYLNSIAQQVFYSIYKNKKSNFSNLKQFWAEDLPRIIYESRKELLLSLTIFIISVAIGVFSCIHDPHFAKVILGDQYIEMTIENIKSGDPMAVYKKMNQTDMLMGISINNLLVAFKTFVLGIFFTIGTIAIMLYNGIMVGTFQYFFYERGLFMESFLTIWLHGTLEISSIIIAGGAGIKLGSGLIFPGTYSRMQSFQLSAKKSLGLMIGIVPILVFAAIIESFVTRYTEVDDIFKIGLIGASFLFIVSYFVIIPLAKARRGFPPIEEERLPPEKKLTIEHEKIGTNGDIFSSIFMVYKKHLQKILSAVLLTSIIYSIIATNLLKDTLPEFIDFKDWFFISNLFNYDSEGATLLWIMNFIAISLNVFFVTYLLKKEVSPDTTPKLKKYLLLHFYKALLLSALIQLFFFLPVFFIVLSIICILPSLMLWHFVMHKEDLSIFTAIPRTMGLLGEGYMRITGLFVMLSIVSIIYFFLIESPLTFFYFEVLNWNFNLEPAELRVLFITFSSLVSFIGLHMIIPIFSIGFGLSYFSIREIKEAFYLKQRIANLGLKNKNAVKI